MAAKYFATVPTGFYTANDILNRLPSTAVAQIVGESLQVLKARVGTVDLDNVFQTIKASDAAAGAFSQEAVESAVAAASYIYRGAVLERLHPEQLDEVLTEHSELLPEVRETFVSLWDKFTQDGRFKSADAGDEGGLSALRMAQLVSFHWKLGVAVSSTHCGELNSPFVTLKLNVADAAGHVQCHTLELNLQQFEEFISTFRHLATQLEQV